MRAYLSATGIRRHATGRGKGRESGAESGNDILEVPPPVAITGFLRALYSSETKTSVAAHPA